MKGAQIVKTTVNRLRYMGVCNICGHRGMFAVRPDARDNLRETLECASCSAISRDRFMAAVMAHCLKKPTILAEWPIEREVVIREPSAYRGRAAVLADKVDFRPFRFPEENLEALKDADASIDHIVTSDVFEHIRRDDLAFREVFRVLKPGGYFFLQVPYSHAEHTRTLVQPEGDEDIYLCPPQYHDEDTLVYRIYGHDVLPWLEGIGFCVGYVNQGFPRWGVPQMDMIVCRKGALLEHDQRHLVKFDRTWPI